MTTQRKKPSAPAAKPSEDKEDLTHTPEEIISEQMEEAVEEEPSAPPAPTGKIFLGEEDKRLLKKFNKHLVNKLGLGGNRSFKV